MIHSADSRLCLAGVKVLDLSQHLPGPYCSRLLSDLGAEVIKVEPVGVNSDSIVHKVKKSARGNDPARLLPKFFLALHYNKKMIAVDLKTPEGLEIVERLIADVDVFLEGFRPGVCEKLGLGFERVKKLNPRIVYCSISGFGQTGPLSELPTHDLNLQGFSGSTELDVYRGSQFSSLPIADFTTATSAACAISSALFKLKAHQDAAAIYIDAAMSEPLAHMVSIWGHTYVTKAEFKSQLGLDKKFRSSFVKAVIDRVAHYFVRFGFLKLLPHYGIFETKDKGKIVLGIVDEQQFWQQLCEELGAWWPKISKLKMHQRMLLCPLIRALLRRAFKKRVRNDWLESLAVRRKLPVNLVNDKSSIFDVAQFRERKKIAKVNNQEVFLSPYLHAQEAVNVDVTLGADTKRILESLGYTATQLSDLQDKEIIA